MRASFLPDEIYLYLSIYPALPCPPCLLQEARARRHKVQPLPPGELPLAPARWHRHRGCLRGRGAHRRGDRSFCCSRPAAADPSERVGLLTSASEPCRLRAAHPSCVELWSRVPLVCGKATDGTPCAVCSLPTYESITTCELAGFEPRIPPVCNSGPVCRL